MTTEPVEPEDTIDRAISQWARQSLQMPAEGETLLGTYVLEARIGKGGSGEVWRARHLRLGEPVAVKFFAGGMLSSASQHELEALKQARVPGVQIAHIRDYFPGDATHLPFVVTDYVEGRTLRSILAEAQGSPLAPQDVTRYLRQLCHTLQTIHERTGLVHGDITPANIIITPGGDAVLIDFGLAQSGGGALRGYTPAYQPVEDLNAGSQRAENDIHQLAQCGFEALTGVRFRGSDGGARPDWRQLIEQQPLDSHLLQVLTNVLAGTTSSQFSYADLADALLPPTRPDRAVGIGLAVIAVVAIVIIAVVVVQRSTGPAPTMWNDPQVILDPNDREPLPGVATYGDYFGDSIAIAADVAVVTAPFDDNRGDYCGSAHVFVRLGDGRWKPVQKLRPADGGGIEDNFGKAAAIDGRRIVIGAPKDDSIGPAAGAVFIYESDSKGVWSQTAVLYPGNAKAGDWFGNAVALCGDTLIASGGGNAYLFHFDGHAWIETYRVVNTTGTSGDGFAHRVALTADQAFIGIPFEDGASEDAGAVQVVNIMDGRVTGPPLLLRSPVPLPGACFGSALAASDDDLIIGATGESTHGQRTGAAYVYSRNTDGSWEFDQKLTASDASDYDDFGTFVAISGDVAAVAAPSIMYASDTQDTGRAYLFLRTDQGWTQVARICPDGLHARDQFSAATSLDGTTLVCGANLADTFGSQCGRVFFFDVADPHTPKRVPIAIGDGK